MTPEQLDQLYREWLYGSKTMQEIADREKVNQGILSKAFTKRLNRGNLKRINEKYQYA